MVFLLSYVDLVCCTAPMLGSRLHNLRISSVQNVAPFAEVISVKESAGLAQASRQRKHTIFGRIKHEAQTNLMPL